MKRMQQAFSAILLALVLATVPAQAMMGGGHGGGMGGRGGFGGSYGDHHDQMDRWHDDSYRGGNMDRDAARGRLEDYMDRHHGGDYRMGPMTDRGNYYESHVMDPQGHPVERMWIDKRSGAMNRRSLP